MVADKDLRLREADVAAGELRLFSYPVDAQTRVNFLVRRKENGAVEVAFASCRRCFQAGSYQQGKEVTCGHCRELMEVVKASAPVSPEKDCALIHESFSAHQGVEDDDMDVICLGGRVVANTFAWELVRAFLQARFSDAERYRRRLAKVARLESREAGS